MKPLTIILLLLIIIIVYYVYSNDIETFIPRFNKTSLFNTYDSYQQLRPLYHPHIKRGYNTCSCGAKKGNKVDISNCVYNKNQLRNNMKNILLKKESSQNKQTTENFTSDVSQNDDISIDGSGTVINNAINESNNTSGSEISNVNTSSASLLNNIASNVKSSNNTSGSELSNVNTSSASLLNNVASNVKSSNNTSDSGLSNVNTSSASLLNNIASNVKSSNKKRIIKSTNDNVNNKSPSLISSIGSAISSLGSLITDDNQTNNQSNKLTNNQSNNQSTKQSNKMSTQTKTTQTSDIDASKLTNEELQFGYYKIFNDLEEVNKLMYNQLNLPIGNYNTKVINLQADASGCSNCVGSPDTYYLKYAIPKFNSSGSINNILASNIGDYDNTSQITYDNDNLLRTKDKTS